MRKKLKAIAFCIVGILNVLCGMLFFITMANATGSVLQDDSTIVGIPSRGHVIIAYYFYTDLRCDNCLRIEAWSKEAIDSAFTEQLKLGHLVWYALNTDMPEYEHFVDDFDLEMKSLILVEMQDGKQLRWKNCVAVWDLLEDKEAFLAYVRTEVEAYLENR